MNKEEVLSLAKLARVELKEAEAESLSHEFDAILNYVGEVRGAGRESRTGTKGQEKFLVRNVVRKDAEPHDPGLYTQKILEQAPAREGNYIKVKKIL